jgi:hypothetical protein
MKKKKGTNGLYKRRRLSAEEVAEAILKSAGLLTAAAAQLGVNRRTVWNFVRRYESCRRAVEDALESIKDLAESRLYNAIREGQAWAICFFLKTRAQDRGYSEKPKIELTGAGGRPIGIETRLVPPVDVQSVRSILTELFPPTGGNGRNGGDENIRSPQEDRTQGR